MRCLLVEVSDEMYHHFTEIIGKFPKDQVRIREPLNDDDYFSADDDKAYRKALKELENGEAISLEDLKKELLNV